MFTVTATGYVYSDPKVEEGERGKAVCVTIKTKVGQGSVFITARFYGKKMGPILDYIHGRDQVTIAGKVTAIMPKTSAEGLKYMQVYLAGFDFSLPVMSAQQIREEPTSLKLDRIDRNSFAAKSDLSDEEIEF